jgi:hypothetical protein
MSLGFQLSQSRQNLIAQITSVIYIWMQTETDLILQICLSFAVGIFEQVMVTAEGRDPMAKVPIYLHNSGSWIIMSFQLETLCPFLQRDS